MDFSKSKWGKIARVRLTEPPDRFSWKKAEHSGQTGFVARYLAEGCGFFVSSVWHNSQIAS
jgi:hypothetical protein